jgi:deazaflavin-dependent oxidoreductase (nitroreductase family)
MAGSRRRQHALEKYLSNPGMRFALVTGIAPRGFALIETTGRRTGQRRLTPVGNGLDGDVFWLISEHGVRSAYVKNLLADPHVRVKVGRRWHKGRATCLPDDDARRRRTDLDRRNGASGRLNGKFFDASASEPMTIRIDLEPS